MPIEPGKYDEQCTRVRLDTNAKGVLLIVLAGTQGTGFSLQGDVAATMYLPAMLEDCARQLREAHREPAEQRQAQRTSEPVKLADGDNLHTVPLESSGRFGEP